MEARGRANGLEEECEFYQPGAEKFVHSFHDVPEGQEKEANKQAEISNADTTEIEYVEELSYGRIIQGEDGQFYVVMDKGSPNIELDKLNNVQLIINEDGTESLLLTQDSPHGEDGKMLDEKPAQEAETSEGPSASLNSAAPPTSRPPRKHERNANREDEIESGSSNEDEDLLHDMEEDQQLEAGEGSSKRRSRVYGACRCPECHQTFVNTARLERHLAVHQIFGSYLCPLCGKTYKYEYNLFYHWRKTCRDMNDLLSKEERKDMEVNNLRSLVEEVAQKKSLIGPLELGVSSHHLYRGGATSPEKYDTGAQAIIDAHGVTCKDCGIRLPEALLARHIAVHRGEIAVDERSFAGGYPCDLCGLVFRQHTNLIKHWRTSCPEIQVNLPDECDIALDDVGLRQLVQDILAKKASRKGREEGEPQESTASTQLKKAAPIPTEVDDHIDVETAGDEEAFNERWADEQGIVFADDLVNEDEGMLIINEEGQLCTVGRGEATNRPPSTTCQSEAGGYSTASGIALGSQTVQCPECFKPFSNVARLERHLAGAHSAYGTHHCVLCGNRFKYDYNLLYHYRRSCAYTKALIDQETREQLDATGLKKLVRQLATKEHHLPGSSRESPLSTASPSTVAHRQELGDSVVRRQMMRAILPPSLRQQPTQQIPVPQQIQLHPSRPGMPEGQQCPICSIVFYGSAVLDRHIKVAHPYESRMYESNLDIDEQELTEEAGTSMQGNGQSEQQLEPPPTLHPEAYQNRGSMSSTTPMLTQPRYRPV